VETVQALYKLLRYDRHFQFIAEKGDKDECAALLREIVKTIPPDLYHRTWWCANGDCTNRTVEMTYRSIEEQSDIHCEECGAQMIPYR